MRKIDDVERAIFAREGFRVRFVALDPKSKTFPEYAYRAMAPQRWRLSEWKAERLGAYVTFARSMTVLRGDGTPVRTDMRLGNLRDTYYEAEVARSVVAAEPAAGTPIPLGTDELAARRSTRRPKGRRDARTDADADTD